MNRSTASPLLLLVAAICLNTTSAKATPFGFSDDFEAGIDPAKWSLETINGATWTPDVLDGSGVIRAQEPSPWDRNNRMLDIHTRKTDFEDFIATWDMFFSNSSWHRDWRSIYFRAAEASPRVHGYFVQIGVWVPTIPDHYLALWRLDPDGTAVPLNDPPYISYPWEIDTWYSFKLEVVGYDFRLKVWKRSEAEPEEWTLEASDPDRVFAQGGIGFGNYWAAGTYVDNVDVVNLDIDSDGIHNDVDDEPLVASTRFSDSALGGITSGRIVGLDAGITVLILDEPDPAAPDPPRGVRVLVWGPAWGVARIKIDGSGGTYKLNPGSYVLTSGSVTLDVLEGSAEVEFDIVNTLILVGVEGKVVFDEVIQDGDLLELTITVIEGTVAVNGVILPPGESLTLYGLAIDINPGSDINPINPSSQGLIPVAILGSEVVDVMLVDPGTLSFGPSGAAFDHTRGVHYEDVDGDGATDLLAHFRVQETGIAMGENEACLSGLLDGLPFTACDSVDTVPSWVFSGTAVGGATIEFVVNGVALQITTFAGQTAAGVAGAIADAVNENGTLEGMGTRAAAMDGKVFTNGIVTGTVINDAGISDAEINQAAIPLLGRWQVVLLALLLLASSAFWVHRRSRG